MNKTAFVFNVGTSDIQLVQPIEIEGIEYTFLSRKGKLDKDRKSYRELTKFLLDNYEQFKEHITIPIIINTLKNTAIESGKVNGIYLFATNQVPAHFQDTFYAAKLIKRKLKDEQQGNNKAWGGRLNQLEDPKIIQIDDNPADLDVMQMVYKEKMRIFEENNKFSDIYISITGATPAMNTSLLLNAMKYGKSKVQILYLSQGSQQPDILNISSTLLLENHLKTIYQNIHSFEYGEAASYIAQNKKDFCDWTDKTYFLIRNQLLYAESRRSFNFEKAAYYANEAKRHAGPMQRSKIADWFNDVYELRDQSIDSKVPEYMTELYWNMHSLFHKGNYIDFCMRLFRLQEQSLRYMVVNQLGVKMDEKGKNVDVAWLNSQEELLQHLKGFDPSRPVTRKTFEFLIDGYLKMGSQIIVESVFKNLQRLDELSSLRNESIGAHGFKGISKEDIFDKMKKILGIKEIHDLDKALFDFLGEILQGIFGDEVNVETDIYQSINDSIMATIKINTEDLN